MNQIKIDVNKDGEPVVKINDAVPKSLKSQYYCPNCSQPMEVKMSKSTGIGVASCPKCGLIYKTEKKARPDIIEPPDVYAEMIDKYFKYTMGKKIK